MIKNYWFELFAGKSEAEQVGIMRELLIENGFERHEVRNRGCTTDFFTKDGTDNIFAYTCNSKEVALPVIMPKDFAERHYMNNNEFNSIIRLKSHSNKNGSFSPAMTYEGSDNVYVHRVMMKEAGHDMGNLEVDHIGRHHGVILLAELRLCTSIENKSNKPNANFACSKEFLYNKLHDFRNSFWIPFLHYVLGVISYNDMAELRKLELGIV